MIGLRTRVLAPGVLVALMLSACTITVEAPTAQSPTPAPTDLFAPSPRPSASVTPTTPTAPTPSAAASTVAEALGCKLGPDDQIPDVVDAASMAAAIEKVRADRQEVSGGIVTMQFFREEDLGESWLMFIDGAGVASFRVWNNDSGGASIILERYCDGS